MSHTFLYIIAVALFMILHHVRSDRDFVRVRTRKLSSQHDLSYPFYSLRFCRPETIEQSFENLGEYLFGDRIENSVYNFKREPRPITCQPLNNNQKIDNGHRDYVPITCDPLDSDSLNELIRRVEEDYHVELIIDGLPVANQQWKGLCGELPDISAQPSTDIFDEAEGFPLGCPATSQQQDQRDWFINNHWTFSLSYHMSDGELRIVGAHVIPSSIDWREHQGKCDPKFDMPTSVKKLKLDKSLIGKQIPWSYSVVWRESDVKYASRWDAYLKLSRADRNVQWFSIINSLMIIAFLTGMVAIIMLRILSRDIAYYNLNTDEPDETGWKLVHADVFRKPPLSTLLCIMVGTGTQVLCMTIISLAFAAIGFVSASHRGAIIQLMIIFFVLMGTPAGYVTIRLYQLMGGERWKGVTLLAALLFPGALFFAFSTLNLLIRVSTHSSNAVPFSQIAMLFGLWALVSVPLVFLGGYFAWRQAPLKHPVSTQRIPRQIGPQSIWMRAPFAILLGGILPFGAIFFQVYFIMSSIWLHRYYFVFGLMFIVFLILIVTCAEITIVLTYFQLCNEDYRWWWRSFFTSGASAIYLFLYAIFYFFRLHVDSWVLGIVFFEYMSIVTFLFFLLTGTIGFVSSLWFTRKIYASIRID